VIILISYVETNNNLEIKYLEDCKFLRLVLEIHKLYNNNRLRTVKSQKYFRRRF